MRVMVGGERKDVAEGIGEVAHWEESRVHRAVVQALLKLKIRDMRVK